MKNTCVLSVHELLVLILMIGEKSSSSMFGHLISSGNVNHSNYENRLWTLN